MGLIPQEVISEIRDRADIVAVIGRHVDLRKAGRSHKGLCPFHNEKTPSFNVHGDKGFFYCFGCQKKGDVFGFVMEYEGKSFVEAAESLAAITGIELPKTEEPAAARRMRSERASMLELNKLATSFFEAQLWDDTIGAGARAYLAERGITDDTARAFRLGYAPAEWRSCGDHLVANRVPVELAVGVGLVVPQQQRRGVYDRFRDRLMCPIIVPGGEVVGFSGRRLADEEAEGARGGAKYINSPESAVYKKSKLLFGLHRARDAFRKKRQAVLVEGNFDVISLHQAGWDETVAPLGTALTDQQVDQLRRLADQVVLVYDGDKAGRAASLKALRVLAAADVPVRMAVLPTGEDPDSLIKERGAEAFAALIESAQPGIEYFIHDVWSRNAASADGRAQALSEAAEIVAGVKNPTKRDLIAGTLAAAMNVDLGLVRRALARGRSPGRSRERRYEPTRTPDRPRERQPQPPADRHPFAPDMAGEPVGEPEIGGRQRPHDEDFHRGQRAPEEDFQPNAPTARAEAEHIGHAVDPEPRSTSPRKTTPAPREEVEILAILADHPKLMELAEQQGVFSLLTDARLRDMYSAAREGEPLMSAAPDELSPLVVKRMLASAYANVTDPSRCLTEAVTGLKRARDRAHLRTLQQQANQAKRIGDSKRERELVLEILNLRKQVD